jgi:hypothetical protein
VDLHDAPVGTTGSVAMGSVADDIETQLADLSGVSISALRSVDAGMLRPSLRRIVEQVERPRANVGGGDPPARED